MLYKTKSILIEATPIAGKMVILSEKDFLRICELADATEALLATPLPPLPKKPRKPRLKPLPITEDRTDEQRAIADGD